MNILLIAGHGAGDCGATGCGYKEADLTREMVKLVKPKLEKYATVVIADTSVNWFNAKGSLPLSGVDYALEFHLNACVNDQNGNGATTGTEIFVTTIEKGTEVEENIVNNISALGLKNRGVKRKNFSVINYIKNCGISSALLELCFIDDADDMKIYSAKKNEIADAIVKGIVDGFRLKGEVNKLLGEGEKDMGVKTYSVSKDGNANLSKNFKVKEFACNDGSDKVIIDEKLVDILQKIRDHFGVPVTINSAYRTAEYNSKIGGVSNSQHTKGTAADIDVKGISPKQVAQYAEYLMPDMGGIGEYETFTHVDVRGARSRWQNFGSEVVVNGFPGYEEPKVELTSANDIIWELMNGALKVEILDVPRALEHLEQAKAGGSSLYWILRKIVNK